MVTAAVVLMTPAEFGGWASSTVLVLGALFKGAQAIGKSVGGVMATKATERRTDLTFIIERQDAELENLRHDVAAVRKEGQDKLDAAERDCAVRIQQVEQRCEEHELKVKVMERVLFNMGYRQEDNGDWSPPPRRRG